MCRSSRRFILALFLGALALVACGGEKGGGSGESPTYTISGTVSGDVSDGVLITLVGDLAAGREILTTTTSGSGRYSFSGVANGSFGLTASLPGYTFTPARLTVTMAGGDATGQNFESSAASVVCSADHWCTQTPPAQTLGLMSVWGSSASDVWVVGFVGAIFHWNGTAWSAVPGGTSSYLLGVWGSGADDVWAVGSTVCRPDCRGTILHWNGRAWSSITVVMPLTAVWGTSPSDVWAVGSDGVLHFDGSEWANVFSASAANLSGVWGSAANDVWVVGAFPGILHWNGGAWSLATSGGSTALRAIWGSGPDDVWAVGTCDQTRCEGTFVHWNGRTWSSVGGGKSFVAVSGTSADDVWAVGWGDDVVHWDGSAWSTMSSGTTGAFNGVWGSGPTDAWAVGNSVVHYSP